MRKTAAKYSLLRGDIQTGKVVFCGGEQFVKWRRSILCGMGISRPARRSSEVREMRKTAAAVWAESMHKTANVEKGRERFCVYFNIFALGN